MVDLGLREGVTYGFGRVFASVEGGDLVLALPTIWAEPWRVPLNEMCVVTDETEVVGGEEPALRHLWTATRQPDGWLGVVFERPRKLPPPHPEFAKPLAVRSKSGAFLIAGDSYLVPDEMVARAEVPGLFIQVRDVEPARQSLLDAGCVPCAQVPGRSVTNKQALRSMIRLAGIATIAVLATWGVAVAVGASPEVGLAVGVAVAPVVAALTAARTTRG